ncbi:hypothetical protein Ct61P_01458 [Colletotrichum tofieldiae]|nr:hypothetical protein Ct61P_01458 [Colletotrichum tofieldiae]
MSSAGERYTKARSVQAKRQVDIGDEDERARVAMPAEMQQQLGLAGAAAALCQDDARLRCRA